MSDSPTLYWQAVFKFTSFIGRSSCHVEERRVGAPVLLSVHLHYVRTLVAPVTHIGLY